MDTKAALFCSKILIDDRFEFSKIGQEECPKYIRDVIGMARSGPQHLQFAVFTCTSQTRDSGLEEEERRVRDLWIAGGVLCFQE